MDDQPTGIIEARVSAAPFVDEIIFVKKRNSRVLGSNVKLTPEFVPLKFSLVWVYTLNDDEAMDSIKSNLPRHYISRRKDCGRKSNNICRILTRVERP